MKKFAFVSRHEPTPEQHALAAEQGIRLVYVGDRDAFAFEPQVLRSIKCVGVVVVHPLIAVRAISARMAVGVFENGNRAEIGQPPQFFPKRLVVVEPAEYHCETCANSCGEHCRT